MATKAKQWKNKQSTGTEELELPSENTALVRRLQPEAFLTSGVIPDQLSGLVTKAIQSKKGLPPQALTDISKDPKQLRAALEMVDRVLVYVVVEPKVEMPPTCKIAMDGEPCNSYVDVPQHTDPSHPQRHEFVEGDRDEDVLYADQVSLEDKQFIFNFAVGGTRDVERFRQQFADGVGDLSNRQAVARKTKRNPRNR